MLKIKQFMQLQTYDLNLTLSKFDFNLTELFTLYRSTEYNYLKRV